MKRYPGLQLFPTLGARLHLKRTSSCKVLEGKSVNSFSEQPQCGVNSLLEGFFKKNMKQESLGEKFKPCLFSLLCTAANLNGFRKLPHLLDAAPISQRISSVNNDPNSGPKTFSRSAQHHSKFWFMFREIFWTRGMCKLKTRHVYSIVIQFLWELINNNTDISPCCIPNLPFFCITKANQIYSRDDTFSVSHKYKKATKTGCHIQGDNILLSWLYIEAGADIQSGSIWH